MAEQLLHEHWYDYDRKKILDGRNTKDFNCTEVWEVDYLVRKIKSVYPYFTDFEIRNAIRFCCQGHNKPQSRVGFVQQVMRRLRGF
jgi:hypothetical protein